MARKSWLYLALTGLGVALILSASLDAATPRGPRFTHSQVRLTRTDGKVLTFSVEVAATDAQQAYGLMYRQHLAADAGMIFPYDPPREVAFWMKNTLIPLDMLFIAPDHHIARIVANAVPLDVTPIASAQPVSAVIEIKGGMAAADGLAVGDLADTNNAIDP